ncbi:uncharacterized protein LOC120637543 [Pararge aegeria]|uniref:Jg25166 protein n=2 Tax=Pararge aegeria TaxID=116150 RepID=A0A8S4RUR5_9NEOP|nr:uncharacterized protein LOC120637543 [Pararge aegeria]CAH2242233.1 jg25166 [Pararge aegeria aegeria]
MGKKSRHSSHRSKSVHSFLSIQKSEKFLNKTHSKTRKNIKKLFEHLRNEGDSCSSSRSDSTVIEVDGNNPQEKENGTSGFIMVGGEDDDLIINNSPCPIQCSTPLSTSKHSIKKTNSPFRINNNSNSAQNFQQEVEDLTKEINSDSYLTIDLTTESGLNTTNQHNTVIDLANTIDNNCTFPNESLSMSGDSDVTVINTKKHKEQLNNAQMKKFASGIAKMDSSERGKLLEFIAQKIFNGCNGPSSGNLSLHSLKNGVTRATETVEDTYIKEIILGKATSRNSIGSNIYNPERDIRNKTGLRMIVIDGSNVAMQHSKGRKFSVKALKICIDYFLQRGHVVKAFVPRFRCKLGKSTDGRLLDVLERQGHVVYTPSREIQGRMITSYDDRYIVQCAAEFDGVIVSGDNYRDLMTENPRWRHVIENRLLQFTWVGDMIMFPRDPLGRCGPTLEQFLRHPST